MPIHPEFTASIFLGRKHVEFRKIAFSKKPDAILVYSTRPTSKVVGLFFVNELDVDSPESLWNKYGSIGGIDIDRFLDYYSQSNLGLAITIRKTIEFGSPMTLREFGIENYTPQNYIYIKYKILQDNLNPFLLNDIETTLYKHHSRTGS